MILNVLNFLNKNINHQGFKYLTKDQIGKELNNFIKLLKEFKPKDKNENIKFDKNNLVLLEQNINKIEYKYYYDIIKTTKSLLLSLDEFEDISKFNNELSTLLQGIIVPIITLNDLFSKSFKRLYVTRILCLGVNVEIRNLVHWKAQFENNSEQFIKAFKNHLVHILNSIKTKSAINTNLKVIHHFNHTNLNLNLNMNNKLINIISNTNYNFKNDVGCLEICYLNDNKMFSLSNSKQQETLKCLSFLELNAIPYCFYNNNLYDSHSISVYELYKFNHAYIENENLFVIPENPPRLGNILLVNNFVKQKITRDVILDKINAYHNACVHLNVSKSNLILVGDSMAYMTNYNLAALDFIILMLVCSITNRSLRYNLLDIHESLFNKIKDVVCRLSSKKLYNILTTDYNINNDPLDNFKEVTEMNL